MAPTHIIADNPYHGDARTTETERLTPTVALHPGAIMASAADRGPAWMPEDVRPLAGLGLLMFALMALGVAWRAAVFAAGFKAGYLAGHAAGILQPWIDARGWIVLLFVAIGVPMLVIYRHNCQSAVHNPPWYDE